MSCEVFLRTCELQSVEVNIVSCEVFLWGLCSFFLCLFPSHIPGLGNSYFWRKRLNEYIGNAELPTRGALGPKLATHPTGCPRGPL